MTESMAEPSTEATAQEGDSQQSGMRGALFGMKMERASILSQLLQAINWEPNMKVQVTISSRGIKFTAEQVNVMQATVFLQKHLFQAFAVDVSQVKEGFYFGLDLSVLIDCLNLYGNTSVHPTTLQMVMPPSGTPLSIWLRHKDILTDINMNLFAIDRIYPFPFSASRMVNKLIIDSTWLKEAFNELDWSADDVTLTLSPDAPHFRLTTGGVLGSCQVDCPADSEMIESFECAQTQANRYKFSILKPSVKALQVATKTQLRTNVDGALSLQHMVKVEDGSSCFIDFFVCPCEEIGSDGDEGDPM
eukprot:TRINITY_DN5569_c0_g1_i2.p1 TRINITY_DN5569_c0_g1~~TRINITY_DN5569_c0_g1_i2.p1  ORF type:complete len:318 (+),score=84.62 TRINITY_DN5569_c0_g1_i2:44-955(+)